MKFSNYAYGIRKRGIFLSCVIFVHGVLFPIVRGRIYSYLFHFDSIGKNVRFFPDIEFYNPAISLGDDVTVDKRVRFGGNGKISVGNSTGIGAYTYLESLLEIRIGKGCQIASFCYFIDHDHYFVDPDLPFIEQTNLENDLKTAKPIVIEDNCWIGTKATILKGVHIGTGSIIGAGAVVTHDIPAHSVAAGVPAKVIKQLK